jgi:hypothetical protein
MMPVPSLVLFGEARSTDTFLDIADQRTFAVDLAISQWQQP